MAKQVKRYGALLLALALIAALAVLLTNRPEEATAAPYTNPFWAVTSRPRNAPAREAAAARAHLSSRLRG